MRYRHIVSPLFLLIILMISFYCLLPMSEVTIPTFKTNDCSFVEKLVFFSLIFSWILYLSLLFYSFTNYVKRLLYSFLSESFFGLILSFPGVFLVTSAKSSPDDTFLGPFLILFPWLKDSSTTKILNETDSFSFLGEILPSLNPINCTPPRPDWKKFLSLLSILMGRYFLVLPFWHIIIARHSL